MQSRSFLGVGIIGAGAMARTYCHCLTHHVQGARLIAVSGGTRAPALAKDYRVAAPATVEALLEMPEIDAVIIATPEMRHLDQATKAAAQGKHILVEKPMTKETPGSQAMVEAAARAKVTLAVCHHWRFRSVHTRALGLLAGGSLGAVRKVRNATLVSLENSLAGVKARPFYLEPEGGGLLMGWAIHNLDWIHCVAQGEPTQVSATSKDVEILGPGRVLAQVAFDNGVKGEVEVDITLPGSERYYFRTEIEAEKGKMSLDGYGDLKVDRGNGWETVWTQPAFNPRDDTCPLRLEGYALMLQAFVDQAQGKPIQQPAGQSHRLASGHDGMVAVSLFQSALRAAAEGRTLSL